jgi:hypothetical protein
MFSYFTISTANKALPDVIKKYRYVLKCREEVAKAEQHLQSGISSPTYRFETYITLKQELNSKITKFYQAIESLEQTGIVIKSIKDGLIDFPAKRFDEEIWLCWKDNESEIKFWHEKDVGFMGRKPIETSDESLV